MTIGERIHNARMDKGMTMDELGKRIGVQKSAINKYEKGIVTNIKRSTIARIAIALDVSPVYLLGYDDPCVDEERLLGLFRSMSDEGRAYLLKTAEMASRTYLKKDTDIPREVG
jgi:transcriptional regulator with XRE-family HTH domain